MNILAIETSCDETAVCLVRAEGDIKNPTFTILGNALYSQIALHAQYGGVFPALAKREHSRNLVPLFEKALTEANLLPNKNVKDELKTNETEEVIKKILEREPELLSHFLQSIIFLQKPDIDAIAVTQGPGLEPALWVGINFAKALSTLWDIPLIPTNHMEGHIFSVLSSPKNNIVFPALALLISGGHTELVLMKGWRDFMVIGQTRDDAVGEAFDKVARMMDLPYPGGPQISKLAAEQRQHTFQMSKIHKTSTPMFKLPRPMIRTDDFDFSFSGLKTSALYALRKLPQISSEAKKEMAEEFENAVTDVLIEKTKKALNEYEIKTLIIGGGVVANQHIKSNFENMILSYPETTLLLPEPHIATDNAVMIAIAGYIKNSFEANKDNSDTAFVAKGNMSY